MSDEPINITEAISEFRKFSRAYKAMEYAETVLDALSQLTKLEQETKNKIEASEAIKNTLTAETQILNTTVGSLQATKYKLEAEIKSLVSEKYSRAEEIMHGAKTVSNKLASDAEAAKDKIKEQISVLEQAKAELVNSLENAKAELKEVKDNIIKAKKQIIQSFS